MSNSFYYFFSATPQVLGGVLALFGVFVVFKIQTIKAGLLSIGEVLNEIVYDLLPQPARKDEEGVNKIRRELHRGILRCIQSQNVNDLNLILSEVTDEGLLQTVKFKSARDKYLSQYSNLQGLVDEIISASVLTVIVIVGTIVLLPLGHIIIKCPPITYVLFGVFIIGVVLCFIKLIGILQKSLRYA